MIIANRFIEKIENLREFLKKEFKWSQILITKQINRRRLSISEFKKKDIIILNNRNIKIDRSNKSLDHKNFELFKIIKIINNIIYELKLSERINIFSIFYL